MAKYYIGWDVGAWYCDNNLKSKDALVILDSSGKIIGKPWRGNLSQLIIAEECLKNFIERLFGLCNVPYQSASDDQFCMAIDTPLGFPVGFRKLLCDGEIYNISELESSYTKDRNRHIHNPYLYRETEKVIAEKFLGQGPLDKKGKKTDIIPLSPIQHMIGAQATKGLNFLSHFKLENVSTGIWSIGNIWTIEVYPTTVCNLNKEVMKQQIKIDSWIENKIFPKSAVKDLIDALKAAIIARDFERYQMEAEHLDKTKFHQPSANVRKEEGWIWALTNTHALSICACSPQ